MVLGLMENKFDGTQIKKTPLTPKLCLLPKKGTNKNVLQLHFLQEYVEKNIANEHKKIVKSLAHF